MLIPHVDNLTATTMDTMSSSCACSRWLHVHAVCMNDATRMEPYRASAVDAADNFLILCTQLSTLCSHATLPLHPTNAAPVGTAPNGPASLLGTAAQAPIT